MLYVRAKAGVLAVRRMSWVSRLDLGNVPKIQQAAGREGVLQRGVSVAWEWE
jgi:hypothetical protein